MIKSDINANYLHYSIKAVLVRSNSDLFRIFFRRKYDVRKANHVSNRIFLLSYLVIRRKIIESYFH